MVRDGLFYGLGLLCVAALVWLMTHLLWMIVPPILLAAFFLWFFRDPNRSVPTTPGVVVSPADGKIHEAEWIETRSGTRLRISIFLNVFDVHVNRVPVSGTVTGVEYREGAFRNAMDAESATHNEQTNIVVDTGTHVVVFRQIAGLLARRIVCNLKVGERVERGARMGLIKFGSRTDLLLPGGSMLKVSKGQRVKGGSTILAELPPSESR
jgi:phosphatidylserine decarboxylase